MDIYALTKRIEETQGPQCASWKETLRREVIDAIYAYTDACVDTCTGRHPGFRKISDIFEDLETILHYVFGLIPEEKEV